MRSLQSLTMGSSSPACRSSVASRTIRTWVKRLSGRWAPSQMSLMYSDTRNAAVAEEGRQQGWQSVSGKMSHLPTHIHGTWGSAKPPVATCSRHADEANGFCLCSTWGLILLDHFIFLFWEGEGGTQGCKLRASFSAVSITDTRFLPKAEAEMASPLARRAQGQPLRSRKGGAGPPQGLTTGSKDQAVLRAHPPPTSSSSASDPGGGCYLARPHPPRAEKSGAGPPPPAAEGSPQGPGRPPAAA